MEGVGVMFLLKRKIPAVFNLYHENFLNGLSLVVACSKLCLVGVSIGWKGEGNEL